MCDTCDMCILKPSHNRRVTCVTRVTCVYYSATMIKFSPLEILGVSKTI